MKLKKSSIFKKFLVVLFFAFALIFGIFKPPYIMADSQVNSWYSFNSFINQDEDITQNLSAQAVYLFTFDPYGEGEVSSNTINNITYVASTHKLYYSIAFYDRHLNVYDSMDFVVYDNGAWVDENMRYLFISSTISDDFEQFLFDDGIFSYTAQLPQSTIGELIFEIADIIPHTIQSLTSFEIFGFTLFAIFGSFVVILLIIKLVKGIGL